MESRSIIVVTGATGQQGGSVVDALLADGRWAVRAVTRDPDSKKAKALTQRGVEVVKGDQGDVASLREAFKGAYGAFAVTLASFNCGGAAQEIQFGKNMVDAAQQAGVKHFVWSGLEDVRKLPEVCEQLDEVEPGYLLPHFESKAKISEHLEASGLPFTILQASEFFDNFLGLMPFVPQDDGSHAIFTNGSTEKGYAASEAADVGHSAVAVLNAPGKYLGKTVPVVSEYLNFTDAAATISAATGKKLKFVAIPDEKAAKMAFPGAADLANMWKYYKVGSYLNDGRPLDGRVYKGRTFKEWVEEHKPELAARLQ